MTDNYAEELRAQLGRGRHRRRGDHDRDVTRLLSPWRRHGGGRDPVARRG